MAEKSLATLSPISTLPDEQEWGTIFKMAQHLVPTGFLPKGIDTPQKAAAILLKGRELGIPPMQALGNIAIINQKPVIQAELMVAMVKRAYGRDVIWVEESTDTFAKVGYLVHGKARFYIYTIEMAKQANLTRNPVWNQHTAAMLRARTLSAVSRMEFPEVIGGMYVPGEVGDSVSVDPATGEVTTAYDYEISPQEVPQAGAVNAAIASPQHPDRETSMRRLHAVADEQGLTHDDLHLWALDRGKDSLTKLTTAALITMANKLENETEKALGYFNELRSKNGSTGSDADQADSVPEGPQEELEGEYQEVDRETGEIIPAHVGRGSQASFIDMPDEPAHARA